MNRYFKICLKETIIAKFGIVTALIVAYILSLSTGGPGLEPPYRPARNPQMNKMMPTRPNYPGMMPGMQGSMPGMMGMDKQYPMGYKPQPTMPQGQILRQQLQVRLVSQSALTGQATPFSQVELTKSSS